MSLVSIGGTAGVGLADARSLDDGVGPAAGIFTQAVRADIVTSTPARILTLVETQRGLRGYGGQQTDRHPSFGYVGPLAKALGEPNIG